MTRRAAGSIERLARDRWRVRVSAGHDPATGRRVRASRVVRGGRGDAEQALARLLLDTGHGVSPTMTVATYLLDVYLPHKQVTVRPRTLDGYEARLRGHVVPHVGTLRLDALSPYVLDRWVATLRASGMREANLLNTYRVLAAALRQAVAWRLIDTNPLASVPAPRRPRREVTTLTIEQARTLLDAARDSDAWPVVLLALAAGLRRSEIAGLTWADLDLDAGVLRVERGVHVRRGTLIIEPPKSATSRRAVSLPPWAIDGLRPLRGLGYVASPDGSLPNPDALSRAYKRVADPLGITLPLRDLRHTHATLLLAAGVDLVIVSRRLGHSTIAVTDQHYLRPHRSADEDAAARLDPWANVGQLHAP